MDKTNIRIKKPDTSISDLPMTIVVDILLKLCTKSIIMCKCVCKSWHSLISDPQFTNLHLAQAKTCLLIRDRNRARVSRALYLLELEDGSNFDVGYCSCGSIKCERCRHSIKVKAKLKMPLRNAQVMLSQVSDNSDVIFHTKNNCRIKNLIKLKSRGDHIYQVANSCNGLLCLTDASGHDLVVICNPILGEFMYLPKSYNDGNNGSYFTVGLGYCPKNNRYKVIRMFTRQTTWDPAAGELRFGAKMAEIHTLGTDSWRSVDILASKLRFRDDYPVYHEGSLHWICVDNGSESIVSFDLEEEQFHFYSVPSPPCGQGRHLHMGVLGGCLCVCDCYHFDYVYNIDIWVMKDYGVRESWTKLFSTRSLDYLDCQPISFLENGALLMFHHYWNDLMYHDDLRGLRFKHLKFLGIKSELEVIAHTPSFMSIKDIVMAGNVEVLNVNSRCGKLRLFEETYPLLLRKTKKRSGFQL